MILRVGLPKTTGALPSLLERAEVPALVSAGALWDQKRQRFREPGDAITDLDCALDSGGFVAMKLHGGYRFTPAQYLELAWSYGWTWWASMDFCCEPEIAESPETVRERVDRTASTLLELRRLCAVWRDQAVDADAFHLLRGLPDALDDYEARWADPVPVLQGWRPEDYVRSADLTDIVLDGRWPALVGVGSVCRRSLHGEAGIVRILDRLDIELPPETRVHLFGVKGQAWKALRVHPRVASADSQAWGDHARREAYKAGVSCSNELKARTISAWVSAQL